MNSVHPKNHELFALRRLLRQFYLRTWADLQTQVVTPSMKLFANLGESQIGMKRLKRVCKMPLNLASSRQHRFPIDTDGILYRESRTFGSSILGTFRR
jgi:hypothetical protein